MLSVSTSSRRGWGWGGGWGVYRVGINVSLCKTLLVSVTLWLVVGS